MKTLMLFLCLSQTAMALTQKEAEKMGLDTGYRHTRPQLQRNNDDSGGLTLCPDGSYIRGSSCHLCPDGTYVNHDRCELAPNGKYY